MAVEFMMGYRNDTFAEDNAVREAASGLESVEKLIKLLSHTQQQYQTTSKSSMENIDTDYTAVADVAVSKFKKVISLLGSSRTGHARFRRAPVAPPPPPAEPRVYRATPVQQIPPPTLHTHAVVTDHSLVPKIERKDSSKTINFSYSNSFVSSLTAGDTDTKQPCSSSPSTAFQITNLSQVSSGGKPPLSSSSLKRKCSSENLGSAKCGSSSSRCHCSKKRYICVCESLFLIYICDVWF